MKKTLALLLAFAIIFSLCACGKTENSWTLPENTAAYKPSCLVPVSFGSMIIQDAGFAKKAQSIIQVSTTTNSLYNTITENRHIGYYTSKDGLALFAFTAVLNNESEQAVTLENLQPEIRFNGDETKVMYGYPAVPFGIPEYYTLEPGKSVEIVFACTAPEQLYSGSSDILMEFADGTIGFHRADLGNYNSIGFTPEDGKTVGNLAEVPAIQEEGVIVARQQHVDEVRGEDISLEYESGRDEYRVHVKLRNLTGYPLIHDKLPNSVEVRLNFLDSNGDTVLNGNVDVGGTDSYTELQIGQAGWDSSYTYVSKSVVEEAASIQIASYEYWYIAINSDGSSQTVDGTFTNPLVMDISEALD